MKGRWRPWRDDEERKKKEESVCPVATVTT